MMWNRHATCKLTRMLLRQVETCPVLYDMNWQDCLRKVWTNFVWCKLTGFNLSSFVWCNGLFKTSLEEAKEIWNGKKNEKIEEK
jgi:hypothetical protein